MVDDRLPQIGVRMGLEQAAQHRELALQILELPGETVGSVHECLDLARSPFTLQDPVAHDLPPMRLQIGKRIVEGLPVDLVGRARTRDTQEGQAKHERDEQQLLQHEIPPESRNLSDPDDRAKASETANPGQEFEAARILRSETL
ncbi:MAG: hypothetical protein ACJ76N_09390 [Thermoanaerobaculia bacterium]